MATIPEALSVGTLVSYSTKQDIVYQTVKESIVYGSLSPGERLTIRDLAAKLGVSETPVRAALIRLQSEGLVDYITHIGATVAPLRHQDISDAHAVVAVLQGLATERAAEKALPEEIDRLRKMLDRLEALPASASPIEYNALNRGFHRAIVEISGYSVMSAAMDQLFDILNRAEIVWRKLATHREKARHEHRKILNAIEARNPAEARTLMEKHFLRAGKDFAEQLAHLQAEHVSAE